MAHLQNFHHQIYGPENAPRVVFLHGLMGAGNNWRKIVMGFEKTHRILTFDQRGHGRSFHPAAGYAPQDYANDLRAILDELGWDVVHLVGHSMGARNGLIFASQFSHRVKSFVIEDIGPEINQAAGDYLRYLVALVPVPFASKAEARAFFKGPFEEQIADNPNARILSQFFYTNIDEKPDGTADWRFSREAVFASLARGRDYDYWNEFRALSMPTLLVRGELSKDLTRSTFDKMLAENRHVRGIEIADAGHWVHFDQPTEFMAALREFWASI